MKNFHEEKFTSIETVQLEFKQAGYICSRQIATTVYLAYHLCKPILVEGPAGVGKTELAKTAALFLGVPLIRLQCYEGLDESKALYEWKYGKQLLYTQLLRDKLDQIIKGENGLDRSIQRLHQYDDIFFSMDFLEPRPLLKAIQEKRGAVLLVDEVDKSDDEFEAFLLEVLSDFQVSIPEVGTIAAVSKPFVFLTSNNTRELSEALKRRCLHLYIPFPDQKLEREIVRIKVPGISERLEAQLVAFIHEVRKLDIKKVPSISESIDWARVLMILHVDKLDVDLIHDTLNTFVKFEEDVKLIKEQLRGLAEKAMNVA
ncbi:MAG TPA: MoxR family ATPase [Syntrophales bacterium]|nr:MoxR family ATPase [Syntrophales bacterium]HOX95205.1 MoxR family ATPase [Syntrophales bacterium]HPI55807.1 MoxR family ATPase [Syntrophales bacterium]HPN23701.1 MoxR family ATPase [Syntrophales bacterium]HQM27774.1 MoxR family ATPase [Syntrophales bacterium]